MPPHHPAVLRHQEGIQHPRASPAKHNHWASCGLAPPPTAPPPIPHTDRSNPSPAAPSPAWRTRGTRFTRLFMAVLLGAVYTSARAAEGGGSRGMRPSHSRCRGRCHRNSDSCRCHQHSDSCRRHRRSVSYRRQRHSGCRRQRRSGVDTLPTRASVLRSFIVPGAVTAAAAAKTARPSPAIVSRVGTHRLPRHGHPNRQAPTLPPLPLPPLLPPQHSSATRRRRLSFTSAATQAGGGATPARSNKESAPRTR